MQARESTANGLPEREWRWEALAALIPVSALAPLLAVGATPFLGGDTHLLGVPYRAAVARAFAAGELPLYSDALCAGHPIHANPHSSWLYPPAALFLLLGPLAGLLAEYAFHLAIAGWGAFKLARAHALPRSAGLIGAAAAGLSGPMVYWHRHYEMVATIAWLPLLLLAGRRLAERGGRRDVVLTAAVAALAFLPGFAQGFALEALVLAAYVGWLAVRARRVRATLSAAAGAAALWACLVAAVAIPAARLTAASVRGEGLGRVAAGAYSAAPLEALNLLVPDLVPNGASGTVGFGYVGLLPWVLLPFALGRSRRAWIAAVLATVFVVALTWGPGTPLWEAAYDRVPALFLHFRNPSRWVLLVGVGAAVVGIAGLPRFLDALERDRARRLLIGLAGAGLLLGCLAAAGGPLGLQSLSRKRLAVAACLLVGAGATALLRTRNARASALTALAVVDMAVFAVPYLNRSDRRMSLEDDPYAKVLRELAATEGARTERSFLGMRYYGWQTMPLGLDLPNVSGYCQLARRPYAELLHAAAHPEWDLSGPIQVDPALLTARELPQRLVDLFHVRRLVGLTPDADSRGIVDVVPRLPPASLHTRFEVIEDDRASVRRVLDPTFEPATTLVVASTPGVETREGPPGTTVRLPGGGDGRWEFDVDAAANAVLRTIEVHQPDWVATVDGEPAPTLRVDHCFLGVVVPPGRHRVRVRYEPRQLGLLLGLYGVAWLLVLAEAASAALVCVRRRCGP